LNRRFILVDDKALTRTRACGHIHRPAERTVMLTGTRRHLKLMLIVGTACLLPATLCGAAGLANPPASAGTPSASSKVDLTDHALRLMQEGNQRFTEGKSVHPNTDVFRIGDTGEHGQHPFAAIVTCADSRLPVERLFDRGVGDLFVVRVAGNIGSANQAGSIEYACEHLGTQLVVVMGHTKCGAVKAAVAGADAGKNIGSLLQHIIPAVQTTRAKHPELTGEALVDAVVRENVWETIEDMLKSSSILREKIVAGDVRMVGAVYDVENGRVEWIGMHPAQAGLLRTRTEETTTVASAEKPAMPMPEIKPTEKPAPSKPTNAPAKPTAAKPVAPVSKPSGDHNDAPAHAATPH